MINYTNEEIEKLLDELLNEMLEPNYFEKLFNNSNDLSFYSFEYFFGSLILDKLGIKYDITNIENKFDEINSLNIPDIDKDDRASIIYENYYNYISNICTNNREKLLELINKKYDIGNAIAWELDNISCLNIDDIKTLIDKGIYNIVEVIPDNLFLELDEKYITKIMDNGETRVLRNQQKFEHIIKNYDLVKTLKKSSFENNLIYSKIDKIEEDTFDKILVEKLYDGIENCKYVCSNDEYVKKLIEEGYYKIILYLSEEQFKEPLLSIIKSNIDNALQGYFSSDKIELLRSDKIYNLFYDNCNNSTSYRRLLEYIPGESLTEKRRIECLLNIDDNHFLNININKEITKEDIKYAIESGYKYSDKTRLSNDEEVKAFIDNGQLEAIETYATTRDINKNIIMDALIKGYKPSEKLINTIRYNIPVITFRNYVESGNYNLTVLYAEIYNPVNYPVNIIKSTLASPYKKELCDYALTDKELFNELYYYNNYNYDVYKYEDEPAIQKYIEFRKNCRYDLTSIIFSKEEIFDYFDSNGPKQELHDRALFNKIAFDYFYSNNNQNYNYDDTIKQYISFTKLCGFITSLCTKKEDIYKYFDSEGPKDELLNTALFDSNLFKRFYIEFVSMNNTMDDYGFGIDKIFEYLENNPSKKQYIKIVEKQNLYEKHGNFISFISSPEEIDLYFDSNGPKQELYEKALFEQSLFGLLFKNDDYKKTCSFDKEIEEYIKLCNKAGVFNLKKYFNNLDDIYKYFDTEGPKQDFYNIVLISDSSLFNILFEGEYFNKYESNPSINSYITYLEKYGYIFGYWINSIDDINNYFDYNGVNEKFKQLINTDLEKTVSALNNYAHNQDIIEKIDYDLLKLFDYYLIDKYFSHLDLKNQSIKYKYLTKKMGPKILFEFENDNIKKLIDIDIEELDKIFNLLNSCKYDVLPYNVLYQNIIISILNEEFEKKFSDIVNVFSNVNYFINICSLEDLNNYVTNGIIMDENTIGLHQWVYSIIDTLQLNEEETKKLYQSIIDCKNLDESGLRKYCRKYLEKKEKMYREYNKVSLLNRIGIDTVLDKEPTIKCLINNLQNNITYEDFCEGRLKVINGINYEEYKDNEFIDELNMSKKEYDLVLSIDNKKFDLIIKCIKERIKPCDEIKNEFRIFKKYIGTFATYTYNNNAFDKNNETYKDINPTIKLDELNIISIMKELNIDIVNNEIISNKEVYNSIKKVFEVYCIGRLPEDLKYYIERELNISLPGGINNIGQFINSYSQILKDKKRILNSRGTEIEKLDDIHLFFMEVIKYISSKNSETVEVKNLLGTEEYIDFISDSKPNNASFSRLDRESKIVKISDYLYTLDKITIPSCDKLITLNNKSINIVVGNRTNASNICHGERTGACMRVGGVGEGLFLKCLTDKNWFHIRFENPITHEYVSRVSGFRNGNTVYLNQLRVSRDKEYSNENLQDYIRKYAQEIIDETKDSEYPIENVFINNAYAMESYHGVVYHFGSDIQKEYNLADVDDLSLNRSGTIWTDVKNNALLLATSAKEGYASLKNGPENADEYECVRDKVCGLHNLLDEEDTRYVQVDINNLMSKIIRVNSMKRKLLGEDYMTIPTLDLENMMDGFVCSDWYVYIDTNHEIYCDYIESIIINDELVPYNNSDKAKEEMECFMNLLKKNYNVTEEVKYAI